MKNRSGSPIVVLASLAMFAAGCGTPEQERSAGGDEAETAPAKGGYEVADVPDGGTITGRVLLAGAPPELADFSISVHESVCAPASPNNRLQAGSGGGVGSAVVFIEEIGRGKPMPSFSEGALTMDQRNCQYTPHLLAAPVGATVIFTNSDDVPHNVRVEDPASDKVLLNRAQPTQGKRDPMQVDRRGPVSVGCDYHPWMNAYVFGIGNPYYAVTDTSGTFVLEDVPPGTYTLKMWLNGFQTKPRTDNQGKIIRYSFGEPHLLQKQVTVPPNGATEVTFEIPAEGT